MAVMSSGVSSELGKGFCYFLENKLGHMGADGGTASRRCATAGFSHGQLDQLSWRLKPACLVRFRQGEASGHTDEGKVDLVNN